MPTAILPEDDDDDWSDFAAARAVDSTSDRKPSESDKATVRWGKPGGAIPLSIFGEEETDDVVVEDGSGGRDDPTVAGGGRDDARRRDVKQIDVKDLIANLYGRDGTASSPGVPERGLEFDANEKVSVRDSEIGGGIKGGNGVADEDDEWEFRAAPKEISAENANFGTEMGAIQDGSDMMSSRKFTSWDALNFKANGHAEFNHFISGANGHGLGSPTKEEDGDDDDDDGWEFQDASLESHYQGILDNRVGYPIKFEDREVVKSSETLNGVISDTGLGPVSDTSANGLRLDVAQKNAYDDDDWGFHAAGTESLFRVESSKANQNAWEISKTVTIPFDSNTGPCGDINVASSETSQGSREAQQALDNDFWDFKDAVPGNSPIDQDLSNGSEAGKNQGNIDSQESLRESVNATSEIGSKHEKNKPSWDTKEALPLSLFGDEELENSYNLPVQNDFIIKENDFMVKGDQEMRVRSTRDTSITDFIASLYTQTSSNPSMTEVHEMNQGGLDSATTVSEQVVVAVEDDSDDWHFLGASVDIRSGAPSLDEHIRQFSSSEFLSTLVSSETTLVKEDPNNNDMSWEFSDALSQAYSAEQSNIPPVTPQNPATKVDLHELVDFYSSLEGELRVAASYHLGSGNIHEDVNIIHNEAFQELHNELHTGELVSEMPSVSPSQRDINIDALVQALREPKFQVLEAEYSLTRRLIMAKKDVESLVELLNHAELVLRLLRLGTEEQYNRYVSTWFKMITACSKELQHGAMIWRHVLEHDLQAQILSKAEGKRFILSMGEIYRVLEVLGVSTRFYKPWLLSSPDYSSITALLYECAKAWSSSGLESALQSISGPLEFQYEGSVEAMVESIEQAQNLDVHVLGEIIFASEDPSCRLSLLISGAVPGLKMVSWNGEQYFLKLINLWANVVNSEPPELPRIYIRDTCS